MKLADLYRCKISPRLNRCFPTNMNRISKYGREIRLEIPINKITTSKDAKKREQTSYYIGGKEKKTIQLESCKTIKLGLSKITLEKSTNK